MAKARKDTPKRRQCGTMVVHNRLLERDPGYRGRLAAIEAATQRHLMMAAVRRPKRIVIPVVVHVVFNIAADNISDAQVKSQINVLNRDYRAKNTDKKKVPAVWSGLVGDADIGFALERKDTSGKATTGITRTNTTQTSFSDDDGVKSAATGGVNAWPTDRYLNIWACALGGGLLGYAQFPGGPPATDGVVILNTAFGTVGTAAAPFNLGRTATHEVGHWLNLHHIWGDGGVQSCQDSDFIHDTPNQAGPNFGKPTFPHVSCTNGPNGDMFMNYMDYVDDDTMVMFTAQQVARIQAALAGP